MLDWLAGNGTYMPGWHCLGGDTAWIANNIGAAVMIVMGYVIIAWQWLASERRHGRVSKDVRNALRSMMWVFLFCGVCGYAFQVVEMWWPARRLRIILMLILAVYTWRFIIFSRGMDLIVSRMDISPEIRAGVQEMQHRIDKLAVQASEARLAGDTPELNALAIEILALRVQNRALLKDLR